MSDYVTKKCEAVHNTAFSKFRKLITLPTHSEKLKL